MREEEKLPAQVPVDATNRFSGHKLWLEQSSKAQNARVWAIVRFDSFEFRHLIFSGGRYTAQRIIDGTLFIDDKSNLVEKDL